MRRSLLATLLLGAVVAVAVTSGAGAAPERHAGGCPRTLAGRTDLGRVASIDGNQLRVVRVDTCAVSTLVRSGVEPPVRWSADGRFIAYGDGEVVAASGGHPSRPLGRLDPGWGSGAPGWVWSPSGHRLAGVTARGGVAIGAPGQRPKQLWRRGWGATSIAWSPQGGTLAVSRSLYPKAPAPYHQEIWLLHLDTGRRSLLWHLAKPRLAPAELSGFSPSGRWLLIWEDTQNSASLAADGVPLVLLPTSGGKPVSLGPELIYGDFVSWCGRNGLAYVRDNGGREVTAGDLINYAGPPPGWPIDTPGEPAGKTHLSFVSPRCTVADGRTVIAAAVGPSKPGEPFGHEHRSIWLMSIGGDWAPLASAPPPGASDELPMWSADRRWIAFIRTTDERSGYRGSLYLLELRRRIDGRAMRIGPVANLSEPGRYSGDYYGYYGWAGRVAWYGR